MWQKKRVWQVTTIIQLALCHLVTSHFQEIACNYTPKGQIRWPIFLLLLCMIVLTEITSKFPKPIIFRILVFSCHKMTLITITTRMPQQQPPSQREKWRNVKNKIIFCTYCSFQSLLDELRKKVVDGAKETADTRQLIKVLRWSSVYVLSLLLRFWY